MRAVRSGPHRRPAPGVPGRVGSGSLLRLLAAVVLLGVALVVVALVD
ncbi:MAG TPA: hypothetical protein VKG45_09725 [Actinomycetes bacterium]|nr:hypothetical protein [Actinomycetes bacterium]